MLPMNKSQLVERFVLASEATQDKLYFQDLPYLREKLITSIETFCVADLTVSNTGKPLITAAQLQKSYLVLYMGNPQNPQDMGEYVQFPLVSIHRTQAAAAPVPFVRELPALLQLKVQWPKCYMYVPGGLGAGQAEKSFFFTVYYADAGAQVNR